jgi:hypothetical protein
MNKGKNELSTELQNVGFNQKESIELIDHGINYASLEACRIPADVTKLLGNKVSRILKEKVLRKWNNNDF